MTLQDLSPNAQDYLKVIWGFHEWGRTPVQPSDLANKAHVRPSTVSGAVARLVSGGYARHDPYGAIELTDTGEQYALAMVRRHRLLETFLVSALHYSWDEVHAEADALEHAASDMMIDRIDDMLGHPATDPHGDPIPRADGSMPNVAETPLSEVEAGAAVTIERVSDEDPELLRYFDAQHITIGTTLRVENQDKTSGTMTLSQLHSPVSANSSESIDSGLNDQPAAAPITLQFSFADSIHVRVLKEDTAAGTHQ